MKGEIVRHFGEVSFVDEEKIIVLEGAQDPKPIEFLRKSFQCTFLPIKGDHVYLCYDKARILRELVPTRKEICEDDITYIFDKYGIIGGATVLYLKDIAADQRELNVGDVLKYVRISGTYEPDNIEFEDVYYRCISFEKIETDETPALVPLVVKQKDMDSALVIEDLFQANAHRHIGVNAELRALLSNPANSGKKISAELNNLIPPKLEFSTYKERFHRLIDLEELNLEAEFEKHTQFGVALVPRPNTKNLFTLEFRGLHELRPSILQGDGVKVTSNVTKEEYEGFVARALMESMHIRFGSEFVEQFEQSDSFDVKFVFSRNVFKQMHRGMSAAVHRLGEEFLFPQEIVFANSPKLNVRIDDGMLKLNHVKIPWIKQDIDDTQKAAVVQALRAELRPLPNIIHGPPGTGKTSTLIEIILHIFTQLKDSRILVATHSNIAANLILSQLLQHDVVKSNVVRLLSVTYEERQKVPDELHPYCATLRLKPPDPDNIEEADATETENGVNIYRSLAPVEPFRIVVGTNIGLSTLMHDRYKYVSDYSHVIIDEAGQCSEPEVLIPISRMAKDGVAILAGDPIQMPPLVLSKHAKERGLELSLLERFVDHFKRIEEQSQSNSGENRANIPLISKLLYNYRSLPSLLQFYNDQFYDGELKATVSDAHSHEAEILAKIQKILPRGLDSRSDCRNMKHAIYFQDVVGSNMKNRNSNSWCNKQEMISIVKLTKALIGLGYGGDDIGVITPYHLQVKYLREAFLNREHPITVTVGTVDEFQGLERKIVLISTVRTDTRNVDLDIRRKMGIVADAKRINVAISRARAVVIVFGRAELLVKDKYWRALIEGCKKNQTFIDY